MRMQLTAQPSTRNPRRLGSASASGVQLYGGALPLGASAALTDPTNPTLGLLHPPQCPPFSPQDHDDGAQYQYPGGYQQEPELAGKGLCARALYDYQAGMGGVSLKWGGFLLNRGGQLLWNGSVLQNGAAPLKLGRFPPVWQRCPGIGGLPPK